MNFNRPALIVTIGLLALAGCSTVPRGTPEKNWMDYLETLRALEADGVALEPGSDAERLALDRFQGLLADFKAPDFTERIPEVYAEDAFFNDTLKTLRGAEAIQEYLGHTAEAVEKGTVEFLDVVSDDGDYYFRWAMTIQFKSIARGEDKLSVGMTHVRFDADGKVVLHQDFWDSTGGFFEHVPALGWMIRRVKARL